MTAEPLGDLRLLERPARNPIKLVKTLRFSAAAILLAGFGISVAGAAVAATYSDSFTVNPTSFNCGYYGSVEICGGYSLLSAPRSMSVGDTATEAVTYTSPVRVPGSRSASLAYITMFDPMVYGGPALPGPDSSRVVSTLSGYKGPLNPILGPYTAGYLEEYVAGTGFCCGYGVPDAGYSITGMTSKFTILAADPSPIVGIGYGYTVTLPATPKLLKSFPGGALGHPAILPAGLVGSVSSNISGTAPDQQFYSFIWQGGLLETKGALVGATFPSTFSFELYSVHGVTLTELDNLSLSSADAFSALMSVNLAPGNYEIGMVSDGPFDPPFTITFDTPVGFAPVAEPGTWVLMILGVGAVGGALRARLRQTSAG